MESKFNEQMNEVITEEWNMRDPARIDRVLKIVGQLWKKMPDFRLGQLLYFVWDDNDLFYVEDDILENLIKEKLEAIKRV